MSCGNCGRLTPPPSQMTISFFFLNSLVEVGKNQKYKLSVSSRALVTGNRPAYDSPMSKSISGIAVPLTTYSLMVVSISN